MSILDVLSLSAMSDQHNIVKSPQATATGGGVFSISGQGLHQNAQGLLDNSTSVTLPSSLHGFQLGSSVYDSLVKDDGGSEGKGDNKVDLYSVSDDKGGLTVVSIPFQDGGEQTSPVTPTQNSSQILSYRPSATTGDAMLSAINYNENEILQDGAFDVSVAGTLSNLDDGILSNIGSRLSENPGSSFDLFDGEGNVNDSYSMDDLSPQPFHDPSSFDGNLGSVIDPESLSADPNKVLDKNKKNKTKFKSQALSPGRQNMTCPTCNKVFNNSSALAKHRLTHSDERKYICNLCHKAFKRQDHLNGHLMTHRDKKPYECNVENCSKSYCDARSLRRHLENHHNQTPEEISVAIAAVASNAAAVIAAAAASNSASIKASGIIQTPSNPAAGDSTDGSTTPSLATTPVNDNSTPLTSPVYNNPHQAFFPIDRIQQQQAQTVPTTQQEQEQTALSSQGQTITIQPHPTTVQQAVTQQQQQQALQSIEPSPPPQQQQPVAHHPWQEHVQVYKTNPVISNPGNGQSPRNGDQSPSYMQQVSPISPVTSVGLVLPTSPVQPSRIWHNNPSPGSSSSDKNVDDASKPVVCSLCDRRFKNIPALNGHMRLHGGYFKKEGKEEKKSKKNVGGNKDMGPPAPIVKQNRSNPAALKLPNVPPHAFQQQLDQVSSPPGTQAGGVMIPDDIQSPVSEASVPASHSDVVSMIHHLQQYQAHHQIQVGVGYWEQQQQLQQQQQQEQQLQHQLQQQIQQLQVEQQQLHQLLEKKIQDQKQQLKQQQQEQQIHQEQQLQHNLQQQIQQLQIEQQQIQQHFDHQIQLQKLKQQGLEQQSQFQLQNTTPGSVPQSPQVVQSPLQRQTSVDSVDYHYQQQAQQDLTPHSSVPQSPDITHQDLSHLSNQQQQDLSHISAQLHLQQLAQQQQQRDLTQQLDLNLSNQDIELNLLQHQPIPQIQSPPLSLSSVSIQSNLQDAIAQIPQFALPTPTSANEMAVPPTKSSFVSPLQLAAGHMKLVTTTENQDLAVAQMLQSMHDNPSSTSLSENSFVPLNVVSNIPSSLHNTLEQSIVDQQASLTQALNTSNSLSLTSHSSGMPDGGGGQTLDNSDIIKSEILDQLTNKMFLSRAAEPNPFSFTSSTDLSSVGSSSVLPSKEPIVPNHNSNNNSNSVIDNTVAASTAKSIQNQHKELRRRLSIGSECDLFSKGSFTSPANLHNVLSSKGSSNTSTYLKPLTPSNNNSHKSSELSRPRMRSKSGDDYKLFRSASVDHSFMRPRSRTEDFLWKYKVPGDESWDKHLSKSDGAGLFRNPNMLASPLKMKRKNRPSPLFIPPHLNNGGFQSRLRSPRVNFTSEGKGNTPPPYTPPPMLSPIRSGSGLFWSLHGMKPPITPKSAPITPRSLLASSRGSSAATIPFFKQESLPQDTKEEEEQPPETDVLPHVNIGPQFQAEIPAYNSNRSGLKYVTCKEDLVWDPSSMKDEEDVQYYQDFATCAAVKGNGANVEYAMHLLHMAKGNIQDAMLALMDGSSKLPVNHTLLSYTYQESDVWSSEEIEKYTQGLIKYDKDFYSIAKEIEGKTCRQCVQLYYLWKKVCPDEHKRLRIIRRKREQEELYNIRTRQQQEQSQAATSTAPAAVSNQMEGSRTEQDAYSDLDSDSSIDNYDQMDKDDDMLSSSSVNASPASFRASPAPVFSCDYPECNATFSSKKALSGHVRIHGGGLSNKTVPVLPPPQETLEFRGPGRPNKPQTSTTNKTPATVSETGESFPCKLCGRVFAKVKSRSAHMKSHRVVDGDKNKVKQPKTLPPTTNKVAITLNNIQESPNG